MKSSKINALVLTLAYAAFTFSVTLHAHAQTVTFLSYFDGGNGSTPVGSVVQATDGNFYGTTAYGGRYGGGNVFRMTPDGQLTSIYSFCAQTNCADGQIPETAPILGSDGALYGVTLAGGTGEYGDGNGVIYRLTLKGEITILHTFSSCYTGCLDGANPTGIILASDGNFYGTTSGGGPSQGGTIFQISSTGTLKTLHSFCSQVNCADGGHVGSPPVQGDDGNFYGVTTGGGTSGDGVFYQITSAGAYKVLYNFTGAYPFALIKGADGNFYGNEYGGVFEVTPAGEYTSIYSIENDDGLGLLYPPLTLGNDGNLYGVLAGASYGSWAGQERGGLFEVTPEGIFKGLYAFCQCGTNNGYAPLDPLFQGTDGNFYGTTAYNGYTGTDKFSGYGTVFQLSTGLGPSVQTVPAGGPAGKSVIILGNGLTGATSVKFNGVAAAFTVESDTYIKATVPAGATSGIVSVVTPSGTLNGNPQFVVAR